ncbi:MAG: hypothetical protein M3O71_14555 [Bacteroidota bacterium]|nr:hypothetical protein [Bacteroidota bacterium]
MEFRPKFADQFFRESSVRGQIITLTILVERIMDRYLCNHFGATKRKKQELLDCVFGNERMTFESKKQVFQVLLESYDNVFVNKNKTIFKDLEKIAMERNLVAHTLANFDDDILDEVEEQISFIKFKNKEKVITYSAEKINEHKTLLIDTMRKLVELNTMVETSLRPGNHKSATEAKASS